MTDMSPSAEERWLEAVKQSQYLRRTAEYIAITKAYADGRASRDAEIREAVEREREACALLPIMFWPDGAPDTHTEYTEFHEGANWYRRAIADAIRARGDRP